MIHPTAIIHESVKLSKLVSVGPYSVIEEGCIIGFAVKIQGHVRIGRDCLIEDHCVIKWGAVLTAKVNLKPNVFFGTAAVVLGSDSDRVECHGTIIGKGCYIGAKAVIFANASIIDETIIGAGAIIRTPIQAKGTYVNLQRQVK